MSATHPRPSGIRLFRALAALTATAMLGACQSSPTRIEASGQQAPGGSSTPEITLSHADGATGVAPADPVTVEVAGGSLTRVTVTVRGAAKSSDVDAAVARQVEGTLSGGGRTWTSTGALEFGTTYAVSARAVGPDGETVTERSAFTTATPDETVRARVSPLDGETVGVGMPVVVYFTAPVTDHAAVERRLTVTTSTPVEGSWHWMDDTEVHYRPRTYWPAGTDVSVSLPLAGVHAGRGVWGDQDRVIDFHVGDAVVSKVDVPNHRMTVLRNGRVLRTLPVSTGKAGFLTRGGVKVVLGKERAKVMDASTIGISEGHPEYYRLDVEYAVRVTWSGEFLHAAPWSTASQGSANVSHGCVGMSTGNARWFFDLAKRGDVVEVTGSPKPMELRNGYGDWNLSWDRWRRGSALHAEGPAPS